MKIILINHIILEIFIIIVDKEKEDFNGIMDKYMMVNGLMVKNKVVVSGKDQMVYHMSDNGIQMWLTALESYYKKIIDIKANLKII